MNDVMRILEKSTCVSDSSFPCVFILILCCRTDYDLHKFHHCTHIVYNSDIQYADWYSILLSITVLSQSFAPHSIKCC
jgi:hypothetical protein